MSTGATWPARNRSGARSRPLPPRLNIISSGGGAETSCKSSDLILIDSQRLYDAAGDRIGTVQHFFDHGCYAAFARYVPFTQPFNADIGVAIWDPDDSYHINVAYNVPAQNYGQFMDSPSVWLGYWSSNKWFHARADVTNTANGCRMTGDTANHDDDNGGTSGSDWNWVQC